MTEIAVIRSSLFSNYLEWFKSHERLLILVLCLGVGVHFYGRVINAWEQHDQRTVNTANAALAADITNTKAIADANAKAAVQYQVLAAQLADANKALAAAQIARNTITQTQQATDRTLLPSDLAVRWTALLKLAPPTIQPTTTGFVVTPDAAITTVEQLENVPTLQADLRDEQTVAANQTTQLNSLLSVNVGLNNQIDALNTQNAAQIKACTDDKNLLKAQARKSKFRWFLGGVVTGFIVRQTVKIYTGF